MLKKAKNLQTAMNNKTEIPKPFANKKKKSETPI